MTAPQQQRRKIKGPLVITANRLWDGAVVYRTADNDWTTDLASAIVITSHEEADRLLAVAHADEHQAVGVYAVPVADVGGAVAPANLREHIRHNGPTIDRGQNRNSSVNDVERDKRNSTLTPSARGSLHVHL